MINKTGRATNLRGLTAILVLGFVLRIYQIGADAFWIDELGVALVAFQDTVPDVLSGVKAHIMAMPLDYLVAWLVAKISHQEGFLRLPEAIWGTATLLVAYVLFVEITRRKAVSLLATFLLSISPVLIRYSQELRFYAPLVFFYLFATWLGMQALRRSGLKRWLAFTVITVVGIYFHYYVIFALGNIILLFALTYRKVWWDDNRFNYFVASALLILLFFALGLYAFGSTYGNPIPLQLYISLDTFLLTGLGWLPPLSSRPVTLVFGFLCAAFAFLGIWASLKKDLKGEAAVFVYSIVIQISAIILFDHLKNYFLSARQLLMLVPLMLFYTASGVGWLIEMLQERCWRGRRQSLVLYFSTVLVFSLAVFPVLGDYYRFQKSPVKEIVSYLSENWQPGEQILVSPTFNVALFQYYGEDPENISGMMAPLDWNQIRSETDLYQSATYLIVSYPLDEARAGVLLGDGFTPVYVPGDEFWYPQMLWQR